jgi:hypothetical protein
MGYVGRIVIIFVKKNRFIITKTLIQPCILGSTARNVPLYPKNKKAMIIKTIASSFIFMT